MSITKRDKLQKAIRDGKVKDQTTMAVFTMISDLEEKIDEEIPQIKDVISRVRGDKGEKGIKGDAGPAGKDGKSIVGPAGKDGKDGRDGFIPEVDTNKIVATSTRMAIEAIKPLIPDISDIEKEIPQLGEEIRDSLELLTGDERLDKSAIKGLDEIMKLAKMPRGGFGLGSPAGALRMDGANSPMADISWDSHKIINLLDPTADQDAATKKYVDDSVGAENLWDRTGTTLSPHTAADSLSLQTTTTSAIGIIFKGADRFIHDFHYVGAVVAAGNNTFLGINAGNFTMGSTATQTYEASYNTGVGYNVLSSLTNGYYNTALGYNALAGSATGAYNIAIGPSALGATASGTWNVAIGTSSQQSTTGSFNVSVGNSTLTQNTTGAGQVALGHAALYSNKTGSSGVAIGYESQGLANNTAVAWTNYNTSVGYQALRGSTTAANNTGNSNTAIGYQTLINNTTGGSNIAVGYTALNANTVGDKNLANGIYSLYSNVSGSNGVAIGYESQRYANNTAVAWTNYNTSVGYQALRGSAIAANNTGNNNTALGYASLYLNTSGGNNTASGVYSLNANTTGSENVSSGYFTLGVNTTGGYNSAYGNYALYANKTGSNGVAIGHNSQRYANDTLTPWTNYNTSVGYQALRGSTTAANNTGNYNTALGYGTLLSVTSGGNNTAIGYNAGQFITNGSTANTTSDYSVYLGANTKASADDAQNEIVIGYNAIGAGSNTIVFGNTSMVGAYFLADNYKIYVGAGNDLQLYHDGTNSYIYNDTGILKFQDAGSGIHIGTANTELLGFYGQTPVNQPDALTAQLTAITFTAPGTPDYAFQDVTNTGAYGFTDAEELRTFISVVSNLQTRVAQLEARLEELGLVTSN